MKNHGDVAIVTGASRGIGFAISNYLYNKGYSLSLLSRTIEDKWKDKERVIVQRCDATNRGDVRNAVQNTLNYFGRIDVLVNVAGIFHTKEIIEEDEEGLDKVYQTNVKGYWYFIKEVLPIMRTQKHGYIINISSMSGKRAFKGKSSYSMSKFAIQALNETLIRENREFGIRATAICPGFVDTDMAKRLKEKNEKLISPLDIAKTVGYLLSLSENTIIQEVCLERELW